MELSWTARIAVALAIGVTPTALANTPNNNSEAKPAQTQTLTPVEARPLAYPETALRYGHEGDCTVRFLVHADGQVSGVEATACTELAFRAEAERYAESLRYAPQSAEAPFEHQITIQWRGDMPETQRTARRQEMRRQALARR